MSQNSSHHGDGVFICNEVGRLTENSGRSKTDYAFFKNVNCNFEGFFIFVFSLPFLNWILFQKFYS